MRKKLKLKKVIFVGVSCLFLAAVLLLLSGCPSTSTGILYLFSSFTGNAYTFDLLSNTCSPDPLFNYGTDAGDYVYFYNGMGYIAAASFTDPKLLSFDPEKETPIPHVFSHTWAGGPSAMVFVSPTKAYVSDSGSYNADTFEPNEDGGIFIFNPSYTGVSLKKIPGTDSNVQGMARVASISKLYIANNNAAPGPDTVSVIDTRTDRETGKINVAENPTALFSLSNGLKIYVISTDYFGNSTLTEIDTASDTVTDTFSITSGAQGGSIKGTKIYYTGGYYDLSFVWHDTGPFFIDVSEGTSAEVLINTNVAGGSTLIYDNRLYVANPSATQSTLTVVDLADNKEIEGSPFDVGGDGDGIKGMAMY